MYASLWVGMRGVTVVWPLFFWLLSDFNLAFAALEGKVVADLILKHEKAFSVSQCHILTFGISEELSQELVSKKKF